MLQKNTSDLITKAMVQMPKVVLTDGIVATVEVELMALEMKIAGGFSLCGKQEVSAFNHLEMK